jgi:hypothetical protein
LIGILPTLAANAINAGTPFATTYAGADVAPPELDANVLRSYVVDLQFYLLLAAIAWTSWLWRSRPGARKVALIVAANLIVNIGFFVTHPIFTQYYTVPISMLSLWTLLFATLPARGEAAAENPAEAQPAKA